MLRLNFYKLNIKKNFKDFVKDIQISSTNIEKGYIQSLEQKQNSLHAFFHLKITIKEKISNPFGETEDINYYYYQKIEFFIYATENQTILIIKDQPKSLKKFIDFLRKSDTLFFSVNNFNIDMESLFDKKIFRITKAKFNDIELSSNTFANIEINSNTNALNDFNILKLKGSKKLTKLKIVESFDDIYFECEFNEKASFLLKIDYCNINIIKYILNSYIL